MDSWLNTLLESAKRNKPLVAGVAVGLSAFTVFVFMSNWGQIARETPVVIPFVAIAFATSGMVAVWVTLAIWSLIVRAASRAYSHLSTSIARSAMRKRLATLDRPTRQFLRAKLRGKSHPIVDIEIDRAHIVQRLRRLGVLSKIPEDLTQRTRIFLTDLAWELICEKPELVQMTWVWQHDARRILADEPEY